MNDNEQPEMIEKEKYLRLAADFENYKRRIEKELVDMSRFGSRLVVSDMLDVLDHFQKALVHMPGDMPTEWIKGIRHVEKQFEAALQKAGVKRIETINKQFDPVTMDAISTVEGTPEQSQLVQSEVRAGWIMHDQVVRPARVIIYQ